MKEVKTNNGKRGGTLKGRSHSQGGIKAVVTDNGKPVELEGEELIVNKKTATSSKKHIFDGKLKTPKQIISDLNVEEGGVPMYKSGGTVYKLGGKLGREYSTKELAKIHGVSNKFIIAQIRIGEKEEKEHGAPAKERIKIAKDHILKSAYYYKELPKFEKKLKKIKKKKNKQLKEGGSIENNNEYKKTYYSIEIGGSDWADEYGIETDDKDKAISNYESVVSSDFGRYEDRDDNYKSLKERTITYKFIGKLDEGEEIEEYFSESDLKNREYWEIIEQSEWDIIENDDVEAVNEQTDEILSDVVDYFGGSYSTIDLNEEGTKTLKLRIKDHSGKHKNKGVEDYMLSIVIAEKDPTKHFHTQSSEGFRPEEEEFYFDSDNTSEEIIEFINDKINEIKQEKIGNKYQNGGNIIADYMALPPEQRKELQAQLKNETKENSTSKVSFAPGGEIKLDRSGNYIGDGKYHVNYKVFDFPEYPFISNSVEKSDTTESVYVTYRNNQNDKKITVRFSLHENNAVKFGDQLNGVLATKDEVLYNLGFKNRKFIPLKRLMIESRQVKKSQIPQYEQAELTIKEMYDLGANADISQYKGKLAQNSNLLILGDKVTEFEETGLNAFGQKVFVGDYIYENIKDNNNKMYGGGNVIADYMALPPEQKKELQNQLKAQTMENRSPSFEFEYGGELTAIQRKEVSDIQAEYDVKITNLRNNIKQIRTARQKAYGVIINRAGLFGDTRSTGDDLFGGEGFEYNEQNIKRAMLPFDEKIVGIEKEIEFYRRERDGRIRDAVAQEEMAFLKGGGVGKSNDRPSEETKKRFSNVKEINRSEITTNPEVFQGRQSVYSEDSVNKIIAEGFDKSNDPIVVWFDKSLDKYIVISGHSRWEASKRLYESGKQPDLKKMPVKEFLGDMDDAVSYAILESNRASTSEGLQSDIKAVSKMAKDGYNKTEMLKYIKPKSYLETVINYTYLNPYGKFIEYLSQPSNQSFPYLQRNAEWVGDLRRMYKDKLTNYHENEIFEYIYQSGAFKGLKLSKDQLYSLIDNKVMKIDFDPSKPLNLSSIVSTSSVTSPIVEEINEYKKEIEYWNKEIQKKQDLIVRARQEGKTEFVSKFETEIAGATSKVISLKEQIARAEKDMKTIENAVTFDLFSDEPVKKETPIANYSIEIDSRYVNYEEAQEVCKNADRNKRTINASVDEKDIQFYKSLGFKIL